MFTEDALVHTKQGAIAVYARRTGQVYLSATVMSLGNKAKKIGCDRNARLQR